MHAHDIISLKKQLLKKS